MDQETCDWRVADEVVRCERRIADLEAKIKAHEEYAIQVQSVIAREEQKARFAEDRYNKADAFAAELQAELAESEAACNAMVPNGDWTRAMLRANVAESACAELRGALEFYGDAANYEAPDPDEYGRGSLAVVLDNGDRARTAIATTAGRGWHSPEEWEAVQGQLGAMRAALQDCSQSPGRVDLSVMPRDDSEAACAALRRTMEDTVWTLNRIMRGADIPLAKTLADCIGRCRTLATGAGKGWYSPEEWAELESSATREIRAAIGHLEAERNQAVETGDLAAEVLAAAERLSDADLSFRSALDAGLREELPRLGPQREQATRDVIAAVEAWKGGGA